MCVAAIAPGLASWLGFGGTAAGAAAGAATLPVLGSLTGVATSTSVAGAGAAATIQSLATLVGVGSTLYSGVAGAKAARQQQRAIEAQAATERALSATEEARRRARMASEIGAQRAQIAARGIDLQSPTAIMLGQTAAQEMAFDAMSVRSAGAARQAELSAQGRIARSRRASSLLSGTFTAAGDLLTAAPDLWPGMFRGEEQLA